MFRRWRYYHKRSLVLAVVFLGFIVLFIKANSTTKDTTGPPELDSEDPDQPNAIPHPGARHKGVELREFPPSRVMDCVTKQTLRKTPSFQGVNIGDVGEEVFQVTETDDHREQMFQDIFDQRVWNIGLNKDKGYGEIQASGLCSTIYNTRETVRMLDSLFRLLKHKLEKQKLRILDVPCGDMVWMNEFLRNRTDIEHYTGIDIVPKLIRNHHVRYANQTNWTFDVHDIVQEPFAGTFDVIITRLMTQHLTNGDTIRALNHLSQSGAQFLFITDYESIDYNSDIKPTRLDRYRRQNLQLAPFYLRPPICTTRDSRVAGWMSLWRLPLVLVDTCRQSYQVRSVRRLGMKHYHCL